MVTLVIALAFAELAITLETDRYAEQRHSEVLHQAGEVRARLEGAINSTIYLSEGLIAYVATHPEFSDDEFNKLAGQLVRGGTRIRDIGLARNNIVTHVYPLAGNEKALGLHYLEVPSQRDAVLQAIRSGHTVVAGPVKLVQGGVGFISRTPIFIDPGMLKPGQNPYWGLASVVIDCDSLFTAAGLHEVKDGVAYALRGRDATGAAGPPFFGRADVWSREPLHLDVVLPGGSWQLAAVPVGGWETNGSRFALYRGVAGLLALLLSVLVFSLLAERRRVHHLALHDPLTGLPNRRLFNDRMEQLISRASRNDGRFALLYLDLDGFKPVNDRHGHEVGDAVLAEVARRLGGALRRSDSVARIGGDEFMLILPDTADAAGASHIAEKIIERIGEPMQVQGHRLRLGGSIGISLYPADGRSVDALLLNADRAMYAAKQAGGNGVRLSVEPSTG